MTISTDSYTAAAGQARQATEKVRRGLQERGAEPSPTRSTRSKLPTVDLTQPVTRYFEYLQKAVDVNRDLATQWAELVTTLSGSVREQAEQVSSIVKDQTDDRRRPGHPAGREGRAGRQGAGREGRAGQARAGRGSRRGREGQGPRSQARRAGRSQKGPAAGPRGLRGADQGRTVRPAGRAGPAQDGQPRGPHRAAGQRRQRVTPLPLL